MFVPAPPPEARQSFRGRWTLCSTANWKKKTCPDCESKSHHITSSQAAEQIISLIYRTFGLHACLMPRGLYNRGNGFRLKCQTRSNSWREDGAQRLTMTWKWTWKSWAVKLKRNVHKTWWTWKRLNAFWPCWFTQNYIQCHVLYHVVAKLDFTDEIHIMWWHLY